MFSGENKREKIVVLLTMCFALFMAMLDNTVVNVALPTIQKDLSAGVSGLQWIIDGYVLAFASLLLTGGILGDRFGRKRMFLSGLFLFTLSSLLCGLAGSTGALIGFRALQGVGGAMLIPGTLSIITVTFPPQERAQALGVWAGVSGIALALGPTLGGWLVEQRGWESIFFLNVPIGIIGLVVGWRVISESRAEQARRLDLVGLGLGTGALFSVTYGLIQANEHGWSDPLIVGSLAVSGLLLAAFLLWEHRTDHAMMPLRLFRIPAFSAGNTVAFAISLGMFGTWFFMSLYMQTIRGYSPLGAGVRFLPMTLMVIVTAPNAGRLASKYGSRWPMTIGLTMAGTGLLLSSRLTATTPYALMVPILIIMGAGMASTIAPMTAAVMNAVGPERAGLGSSMTNTSREVGGVFGIALLGSLLTTRLKSLMTTAIGGLSLPAELRTAVVQSSSHGQLLNDPKLLSSLGPAGPAVKQAYQASFLSGFHLALLVAAFVLFAAAFTAYRFIPSSGVVRSGAPSPELSPVPAH